MTEMLLVMHYDQQANTIERCINTIENILMISVTQIEKIQRFTSNFKSYLSLRSQK